MNQNEMQAWESFPSSGTGSAVQSSRGNLKNLPPTLSLLQNTAMFWRSEFLHTAHLATTIGTSSWSLSEAIAK